MTDLEVSGRNITVSGAGDTVIWFNAFAEESAGLRAKLTESGIGGFTLVTVDVPDWDAALSPWRAEALSPDGEPFPGNAPDYLHLLTDTIMPEVSAACGLSPRRNLLAGYSLAGLFAVWAFWQTDRFHAAASISGSMWYPGFAEYVCSHAPCRVPEQVYLSLGDRECRTRHPLLSAVQENTERVYRRMQELHADTVFELNPGGHTKHAAQRTAKGIAWLLGREDAR